MLRTMLYYVQERPEGCLEISRFVRSRACAPFCRVAALTMPLCRVAALGGPSAGRWRFYRALPDPEHILYPPGPGQHVRYMANMFVNVSENW